MFTSNTGIKFWLCIRSWRLLGDAWGQLELGCFGRETSFKLLSVFRGLDPCWAGSGVRLLEAVSVATDWLELMSFLISKSCGATCFASYANNCSKRSTANPQTIRYCFRGTQYSWCNNRSWWYSINCFIIMIYNRVRDRRPVPGHKLGYLSWFVCLPTRPYPGGKN